VDAQVRNHLREVHGAWPPSDSETATRFLTDYLRQRWRQVRFEGNLAPQREIFVGPPASGKTTFLGKWLARAVLVEERSASVWRLNGRTANTAEGLSVLCQGLNVPIERSWSNDGGPAATAQFIDLPGADWRDAAALNELKVLLQTISHARVHLVLNAAYDIEVLLRQADHFLDLPLSSLILTHLDEQPNRWKLWNLVLGTNLSISFLSAGQNVPGNLTAARAEMLLPCA
jgi:flagellar biosynthesis protein FlhF